MKVILNKDVPNLGEEGDVKDVAAGYARNFLLPRGLVMPYSAQSLSELQGRQAAIEKRKDEKRKAAQSTKERLENQEVVIEMTAGEKGRLFGSVTSANIVEELEKLGVPTDRKHVDLPGGTIKELGTFPVRVRLYGNDEANLKVRVVPDSKSMPQAASGGGRDTETETESAPEPAADAEPAADEAPTAEPEDE